MIEAPKIMIIEGDEADATRLSNEIADAGCRISAVAKSGEMALAKIRQCPPDLVIMDMVLGGRKSGEKIARRIETEFQLPVIRLVSDEGDLHSGRSEIGERFGYLLKPVNREKLYAGIEIAIYKSRMDQALRESEARYRMLVETMNEGVILVDESGKITYANEMFREIWGKERQPIVGHSFEDLLDEENRDTVLAQWEHRKAGKSGTYEITGIRDDGRRIHAIVSATPMLDPNGHFKGSSAVITDITEQKRIEAALRNAGQHLEGKIRERTSDLRLANERLTKEIEDRNRTEASLRHIYDCSPVIMASIDENGAFYDVNQKWTRVTGYTREEIIGRRLDDFLVPEPDSQSGSMPIGACNVGLENIACRLARKNGPMLNVLLDCEPCKSPFGKSVRLIVARDVTEQRQAQNRVWDAKRLLRVVVDGISEPLVMVDCNMVVRLLNKAALDYYRLPDYRTAVGKRCLETLVGETTICEHCTIPHALAESRPTLFERKGLFDPDRVEQVAVYPVREISEGVSGGIIRISDITEKKKVDAQMIQADRLSSLGQLSGGIAHEIRNPLSGIRLFVDVLADEQKFSRSPDEMEILDDIRVNIQKIDGIIKRVLDFARHKEPLFDQIDLNGLIRNTLALWRSKIRLAGIQLETALTEDLHPVPGDGIGLQQVLTNLIQNAMDAMADGGVLSIRTRSGESYYKKGRPVVFLDVGDTGTGISETDRGRVFNPFFTTKTRGVGLGLSISNQIVDRHGGILTFETRLGVGTTFRVELPTGEDL